MTQIATVERILDADHAEISVPRKSACGHDCEECAGCGVTGAAVKAPGPTIPSALSRGEKVVVESSTQKMLGIVALVYAIPVALFLIGYLAAFALGGSVGVQYGTAIAGFVLGILFAIRYDRRLRAQGGLSFTIVRLF